MNEEEARVFMATLAALSADSGSAKTSLIEDAEPMTATCTVEYSDDE